MPMTEPAEQFERAVKRLDEIAEEMRRARRRDRFAGLLIVVLVAIAGFGIVRQIGESAESARIRCRDSNVRFDAMMSVLEDGLAGDASALLIIGQMRAVSIIDCDRDGDTLDDLPSNSLGSRP